MTGHIGKFFCGAHRGTSNCQHVVRRSSDLFCLPPPPRQSSDLFSFPQPPSNKPSALWVKRKVEVKDTGACCISFSKNIASGNNSNNDNYHNDDDDIAAAPAASAPATLETTSTAMEAIVTTRTHTYLG